MKFLNRQLWKQCSEPTEPVTKLGTVTAGHGEPSIELYVARRPGFLDDAYLVYHRVGGEWGRLVDADVVQVHGLDAL